MIETLAKIMVGEMELAPSHVELWHKFGETEHHQTVRRLVLEATGDDAVFGQVVADAEQLGFELALKVIAQFGKAFEPERFLYKTYCIWALDNIKDEAQFVRIFKYIERRMMGEERGCEPCPDRTPSCEGL